ncbi:hypothetical protein AB0A91_29410, partial [Streptomyces sp. NPDC042207]|uniref:hypothetical protein n=1 Tax=Streptomyces sp. NPDC042207 TaxID=3154331 RepID=UPI0033F70427
GRPMSNLEKASQDAVEAADNTEQLKLIAAVLQAQQLLNIQQQAAPACQHHHKAGRSASEWLAIGCAVCVGGVGLAFASIAIAIGATCATVCLLILRRIWQDMQKGR